MTDCSNQCHPDCPDSGGSGHAKWIPLESLSAPIYPSPGMKEDHFDFRHTPPEDDGTGYRQEPIIIGSYQTGGSSDHLPIDGAETWGEPTRGGDDTPMADEDHKHWIDIVSFRGGTAESGDGVEDGFLV